MNSHRTPSQSLSSCKLSTRRLLEFSLNATWNSNGKLGNHSVELNWAELRHHRRLFCKSRSHLKPSTKFEELTRVRSPKSTSNASITYNVDYNKLMPLTDKSATLKLADPYSTGLPGPHENFPLTIDRCRYPLTTSSLSSSRVMSNLQQCTKTRSHTKSCSSVISPISMSQIVRLVSVDLRVAYFEWPGLIVRKQVIREIRNDLTVLEVLQHLIRCAAIRLDSAINAETARLFLLKNISSNHQIFNEVDYLQWRYVLLGNMINADQIQFTLDFTETEDAEVAPTNSDPTTNTLV